MDIQVGTDIYDISLDCSNSFDRVTEDHTAPSYAVVEALRQEFQQWTGNMGVFTRSHRSLDARLVHSESLRDLVIQLLQVAKRNLSRGKLKGALMNNICADHNR
jgi:hypothetical protein